MPKSTLFLPELEHTLQYWEDMNLIAGIFFELSIKKDPILRRHKYEKPMLGTELDSDKKLSRSIKNYKNMRRSIENHIEFDPALYMPRIPTDSRETLDSVNFMRSGGIRSMTAFPYFLQSWLKYKRVYALTSQLTIKEIDVKKKNFLPLLPYGSFIIKFNKPLEVKAENDQKGLYELMMITLDSKDDIIDAMVIPKGVVDQLLTSEERSKLIADPKGYLKKYSFSEEIPPLGISLATEDGDFIANIHRVQNGEETESHVHSLRWGDDLNKEEQSMLETFTFLRNIINGFCKLVSDLSPKEFTVDEDVKDHVPMSRDTQEYAWNSVPITEIRNIKKLGGEIQISNVYGGGEKSPHWRRGHWRRITHNDGSVTRTWIDEIIVREDKLETENLVGSATVLHKDGE
jgi:hypothetical protein